MKGEMPLVRYHGKIQPHSWARYFVNRTIRRNNNNLVVVVGKTGSGKTWSAISIAEIMSKMSGIPFDVDHIVFTLRELMELLNSGKLRKGSIIIFDEPQVSISAREYQSQANKVFNYLVSTFRHRNLTLFFCTPFEKLLDRNTRRLFHARIETEKIDYVNNLAVLKARVLEYSDRQEDPYIKRLIAVAKGGHRKISVWSVPKPSEEMIKVYEEKKLKFTSDLNARLLEKLKRIEEKELGKTKPKEVDKSMEGKALSPKEEEVYLLWKQGLNGQEICKKTRIAQPNVSIYLKNAKIKLGEYML